MNTNLEQMTRAEKEAEIARLSRLLKIFQDSIKESKERYLPGYLLTAISIADQIIELHKSLEPAN